VAAHATSALLLAPTLLGAGACPGVLQGSGMLAASAQAAGAAVPRDGGPHIPVLLGLLAMPMSLMFDPDSFYFGVLLGFTMIIGLVLPSAIRLSRM
jgi:CitMHS family citrate-Mg2+:H+ or citrate-Ca2+:H+ symporter